MEKLTTDILKPSALASLLLLLLSCRTTYVIDQQVFRQLDNPTWKELPESELKEKILAAEKSRDSASLRDLFRNYIYSNRLPVLLDEDLKILGFTNQELVGRPFKDIFGTNKEKVAGFFSKSSHILELPAEFEGKPASVNLDIEYFPEDHCYILGMSIFIEKR